MQFFELLIQYLCVKVRELKKIIIFILLLNFFSVFSQETDDNESIIAIIDSLYREDQVYVGITFNPLTEKPSGFSQNGLSAGFQMGFVRDIPFNKRRNKSIGIGLGFALDTYNQNLLITEESSVAYTILEDNAGEDFNRFSTYSLEVPIEYRWRTSTPTRYSFWRIYTGFKLGYIFGSQSTYKKTNDRLKTNGLSNINTLQYGPTFAFGYGAFNFQGYYGLNPLFSKEAEVNGEQINLQVVRLGLIFYFL